MFRRSSRPGGLSDEEAERRIQKMINFILHDAEDKAAEIMAQAEQDAQRLFQQHLADAEQQLRAEYEEKRKRAEAMYRRKQGQRLVAAELEVLRMRWDKVGRVQLSVHERVDALCQPSNSAYVSLLAYLLAEALLRAADEDAVQLRCRKEDAAVMSSAREQGVLIAAGVLSKYAGVDKRWRVELAEGEWLSPSLHNTANTPEGKQDTQQQPADATRPALGGVLLLIDNGRLRVNNTLDQRCAHTIHALLPVVRCMLWGDDKGYVHRLVEQRRGKRKAGKQKRVLRWEKHEAHIIAVEEEEKADEAAQPAAEVTQQQARQAAGDEMKEGRREEKERGERWWREHEPELKLPPPSWSGSERNTREEQLASPKNTPHSPEQRSERKAN